jgi:acetyl esterase/lipase
MTSLPPLDPELAALIATLPPPPPPLTDLGQIPVAREMMARFIPVPTDEELSRGGAYTVTTTSEAGAELVICSPTGAVGAPVLFYVHGGGMIMGNAREALPFVLDLASVVGAVVVSVEYRLAPEHPHPAPSDDSYAGLDWVARRIADHGGDPTRIVVSGGSAGAGIAAALALMARDRGLALAGALLIAPMLDDRNDSPSAVQMASQPFWNRAANELGWTALLGDTRGTDAVSSYAAPARADDLSGLPPVFIDVGSRDTFRDEDIAFAQRIWLAGGSAELHVWPGAFHGFDAILPGAALAHTAVAARQDWLRRLF